MNNETDILGDALKGMFTDLLESMRKEHDNVRLLFEKTTESFSKVATVAEKIIENLDQLDTRINKLEADIQSIKELEADIQSIKGLATSARKAIYALGSLIIFFGSLITIINFFN